MDLVVYDDDERRYVPWLVSVAAVALTAVLAAALTFLFTRSPAAPEQLGGLTAPQAATTGEPTPSAAASPTPVQPEVAVTLDPPAPSQAAPAPAAPAAASAACATALTTADAVVQRSSALDDALDEHTRIMDELLAQRLSTEQALDETLPVLTDGATERELYAEELAAYEQAREACAN